LNTQLRLNGEQQLRLIEQREKLFEGLQDPTSAARADNPDASPDMIERLKQIDKLKADLAGLQTRVTSKHPDVLRMQEQIAALEKEQAAAEALVDQKQQAAKAAAAASQAATEDARAPRRRTIESIDAELRSCAMKKPRFARRLPPSSSASRAHLSVSRSTRWSRATGRWPRISTIRC
jgi:chromosome segregation ATPase